MNEDYLQKRIASGRQLGLPEAVFAREMFPTPLSHDAKALTPCPSSLKRRTMELGHLAAHGKLGTPGKLNPTWVEWLMGWPLGWTDLKPLETAKFHSWQRKHSQSSKTY
jgi:hypothetical protein